MLLSFQHGLRTIQCTGTLIQFVFPTKVQKTASKIRYLFKNRILLTNYKKLQVLNFNFIYFLNLFHPFLQVKQEDMPPRIQYATLYLLFIGGAYLFSYTRVALCLLVLQYFTETVFHTRLDLTIYNLYSEKYISRSKTIFFYLPPLYKSSILSYLTIFCGILELLFLIFRFFSQNRFLPLDSKKPLRYTVLGPRKMMYC